MLAPSMRAYTRWAKLVLRSAARRPDPGFFVLMVNPRDLVVKRRSQLNL